MGGIWIIFSIDSCREDVLILGTTIISEPNEDTISSRWGGRGGAGTGEKREGGVERANEAEITWGFR